MLLPEFAFPTDVATVAFCGHIFPQCFDRFASDDARANCGLDSDFEHVATDFFLEFLHHGSTTSVRISPIANDAEGIDLVAIDQDVHAHEIRGLVTDDFVVHRAIAPGVAFQFVMHVVDHVSERQLVRQHDPRW